MNVLKELERVMADRLIASGYDNSEFHAVTLGDIRAALAQSAPQTSGSITYHHKACNVFRNLPCSCNYETQPAPQPESAGGETLAGEDAWRSLGIGEVAMTRAEFNRLRARDKWIEERAKPALTRISELAAALASKDADPEYRPIDASGHPMGSAGGLANDGRDWSKFGYGLIHPDELSRLRAWEKWGREMAKPAVDYYSTMRAPEMAKLAIAAMPQDAGEMK